MPGSFRAAADQYFMESGVSTVTLFDLIGPTTYIKALNSIASEAYPAGLHPGHDDHGQLRRAASRTITYLN